MFKSKTEEELVELIAEAIHQAGESARVEGPKISWRKATEKAKEINRVRARGAIEALKEAGATIG